MARTTNERIDIINLIYQGMLFIPDKIKITYRYKSTYTDQCKVYVYAINAEENCNELMAWEYLLPETTCECDPYQSTVIELVNNVGNYTDMYCIISHTESLQNIVNAVAVYDQSDIKQGMSADITYVAPVAIASTITYDDPINPEITFKWNAVDNATGYYIDLSLSPTFATYISGYENKSVGYVTQILYTAEQGSTYYSRVRAAFCDLTSDSSNTIITTTQSV